jgi:hypothetical protein
MTYPTRRPGRPPVQAEIRAVVLIGLAYASLSTASFRASTSLGCTRSRSLASARTPRLNAGQLHQLPLTGIYTALADPSRGVVLAQQNSSTRIPDGRIPRSRSAAAEKIR